MRLLLAVSAVLAVPLYPTHAQNEAALRRAFEGRSVVVRIDMPGTSSGVNVYPGQEMPVDFPDVASKLKKYGTSIRAGDAVMVTKIRVKDDLIEFQLGGGGYGTFGDAMGQSGGGLVTQVGETSAEKALRDSIRSTSNSSDKRRMQRDLDAMRSERERENARARAEAAQAEEIRQANLRGRRVEGGSRFNVRYRGGVPSGALTPDGLRQALSRYVDFGDGPPPTPEAAAGSFATLKKGLMLDDVERLLGSAVTATESDACSLHVMTRTYRKDGQRTTARFVSGVLVDYTVSAE